MFVWVRCRVTTATPPHPSPLPTGEVERRSQPDLLRLAPHRFSRRLVAWLLRLPLKGGVIGVRDNHGGIVPTRCIIIGIVGGGLRAVP